MEQDQELWRTLKCAGKTQEKTSSVDTIMLKYRPIAPKPTTTTGQQPFAGETSSTRSRTKRKYVRVSKNNKATCRSKNGFRSSKSTAADPESISQEREDIVTLQLMPEKSDLYESTPLSFDHNNNNNLKTDTWQLSNGCHYVNQVPVETWATVESVKATTGSVSYAVRCTDDKIADALDKDTCPGFISDGSNRVVMVNDAYRRIITGDGRSEPLDLLPEVIVWLVVDQTATFCDYQNFTCKVRIEYTWRETKYVKTVPCDVMKMEFGGFAWRLDTTAALTLWL